MASETFSFYLSLIYFSIYAVIFFIASIYSFYEVSHSSSSHQPSPSSARNPASSSTASVELGPLTNREEKQNEEHAEERQSPTIKVEIESEHENDIADNIKKKMSKTKFMKLWMKSLWKKKSVYIAIIPHLFDQATDVGVMYTYYKFWKSDESQQHDVNFGALFIASIAVIIVHKAISCAVIYSLTTSITDVLLQFLDLMMVKAVYANYRLKSDEPGNAQRLLQLLEGTFESGPQLFISFLFIIKTNQTDTLVLASCISSLWTLASRVSSDDKGNVKDTYKNHECSLTSCPVVNWRYIFRVFGRVMEISNRIVVISLLWIAVGGFALCFILGIELFIAVTLCVSTGDIMLLANMMYYTIPDDSRTNLFLSWRFISSICYLLLITYFVGQPFEAWKVDDFKVRHSFVLQQTLGLSLFIFAWISSVLFIAYFCIMGAFGFKEVRLSRNVKILAINGQYEEILNLMAFGLSRKKLIFPDDGTIIHCLMSNCTDYQLFTQVCQAVIAKDPEHDIWTIKNRAGKLFFTELNHDAAVEHIKYVIEECKIDLTHVVKEPDSFQKQFMILHTDLFNYLVSTYEALIDINSINNIHLTEINENPRILKNAAMIGMSAQHFVKHSKDNIKAIDVLTRRQKFPQEAKNMVLQMHINLDIGYNDKSMGAFLTRLAEFGFSADNFTFFAEDNTKRLHQLLFAYLNDFPKEFPIIVPQHIMEAMDVRLTLDSWGCQYALERAFNAKMSGNNFMLHKIDNMAMIIELLEYERFPNQGKDILFEMVTNDGSLLKVNGLLPGLLKLGDVEFLQKLEYDEEYIKQYVNQKDNNVFSDATSTAMRNYLQQFKM